jgi:hypothetical protein
MDRQPRTQTFFALRTRRFFRLLLAGAAAHCSGLHARVGPILRGLTRAGRRHLGREPATQDDHPPHASSAALAIMVESHKGLWDCQHQAGWEQDVPLRLIRGWSFVTNGPLDASQVGCTLPAMPLLTTPTTPPKQAAEFAPPAAFLRPILDKVQP